MRDPGALRRGSGRRNHVPRDVSEGAGAAALPCRLRAAQPPSRRWPLRRQPEPPLQALPVAGDPEAVARGHHGSVPPEPRGSRHRPPQARHQVRRGQLGIPYPGRLGHRLAGDARRPRSHPVHLFPAVRRHRPGPCPGRTNLRPGAPRGFSPGHCQCLRH